MTWSLPNLLSLVRMGLIPLFVIAVAQGEPRRALVLFVIAGVTDALDGFIARFFNQVSVLGTFLDPIADKLLLTTAFVMLTIPGLHPGVQIPLWVTVLVLARDVLILILALLFYLALGVSRFPPTPLSKVNTALQIGVIGLVLVTGLVEGLEYPTLVCLYVVGGLTVLSGLDYIYRVHRFGEDGDAATS